MTNENGEIEYDRLDLLVFITGSYRALGKRLGNVGFTRESRRNFKRR